MSHMRVIRLSRRLVTGGAVALVVLFATVVFLGAPKHAQAVDVLPTITLTIGPPANPITITAPPVTRTIVVPPRTITITKPAKTKTVQVRKVITLTRPAKTVTMPPRTVKVPVGISLPRQTVTRYVRMEQDPQTVTQTATVTAMVKTPVQTETVAGRESKIILTKTQFVGYSALVIAAGIIGTLLVCYLLFTLGWLRGDGGNRKFIREIRDELKY